MKIDISKATLQWLEAWKAKKLRSPQTAFYRNIEITQVEAYRRYIGEKLDIYFNDFQVGLNRVVIYVNSVDRSDIVQLMQTKFVLIEGVAVLSHVDTEIYHEPYCEDPSSRLELTFTIPK